MLGDNRILTTERSAHSRHEFTSAVANETLAFGAGSRKSPQVIDRALATELNIPFTKEPEPSVE